MFLVSQEQVHKMKLSIVTILATLAVASAFAPSPSVQKTTVALNAEGPTSRKAFLSAACLAALGAAVVPGVANAGTMGQELVTTKTEEWATGVPVPAPPKNTNFANARTQMTSSFPPIKRLTLEKKSPVTRLDINAPNFSEYKKTYPGLFKEVPK